MTVVVGFVGSDGALMASDSEGTESGHTRVDVEKIWTAGGLLLGYSGTNSVRQPLVDSIEKEIRGAFPGALEIPRWKGRSALENAVGPTLRHCYQNHVGPVNANGIPTALDGALMVLGRDAEGYWLLEIDAMNQPTFYTDPGFHTIGSGSGAAYVAHSLMKDYAPAGRAIADLKLIAHRTVQTCIDTLGGAFGVGGYVHLWYSEGGGAFGRARDDECAAIANGVAEWRGIERESLDQYLSSGEAEAESVPIPEALEEARAERETPSS